MGIIEAVIILLIGIAFGFFIASLTKRKENPEILENKFKVLANDVLRQNSKDFLDQAGTQFGNTERNIKNLMESVSEKVGQWEKEQRGDVGKLIAGVGEVMTMGREISDSAKTIKTVFSSSNTAIGKWGEATLNNLLEKAGMKKGIDFDVQETVLGDNDSVLRPDFIIRIPGSTMKLAIDSKASLGSLAEFENAISNNSLLSEEEKKKYIQKFIEGLKKKIRDLASKEYQKYVDSRIPYVVMFVPVESALIGAFQQDPNLYFDAQSQNIMLASLSTITPLILLIKNGWDQYRATENAIKIKNEVVELQNRLETFFSKMGKVSSDISQVNKSFNEVVGSFERRVRPELERINNLGTTIPVGEEIQQVDESPRTPNTLPEVEMK